MRESSRAVSTLAFLALAVSTAAPSRAAESSVSFYLSNTYIWRGINLNDSGVGQLSIDTAGIKIGSSELSFNTWGNLDIGEDVGEAKGVLQGGKWSEIDLTATLSMPSGFSLGYIEYLFPGGGTGTRELFAGWSGDFVVSPSATFYYDVDEVNDFYATLGVGYSVALSDSASLDFGALAALAGDKFAEAYSGGTKGGFYNYDVNAALSVAATEKLGVGLVIGHSDTLNEDALPKELTQGFYAGASLTISF